MVECQCFEFSFVSRLDIVVMTITGSSYIKRVELSFLGQVPDAMSILV
jgi:hypothetical protein